MTWRSHPLAPPAGSELCRLDDIPAAGLALEWGEGRQAFRLALVRRGETVTAFLNACAHFGVRLNPRPDAGFVDPLDGALVCHVHYARYAPDDGRCLSGDCDGDGLQPVPVSVRAGRVILD